MLDLVELLSQCSKLQKLWLYVSQVMDSIEDKGLKVVASCGVRNCQKEKKGTAKIKVYKSSFSYHFSVMEPLTQQPLDEGFKAIVQRCKDLQLTRPMNTLGYMPRNLKLEIRNCPLGSAALLEIHLPYVRPLHIVFTKMLESHLR
ncbi:unnamed protein product [Brassica oleracea]